MTDDGIIQEYGKGFLTDLSATYPTENNATFTGTISGNGIIRDSPYSVEETKPNLFAVRTTYWVVEEFNIQPYAQGGNIINLVASPDAFEINITPDVNDFMITVNGNSYNAISAFYSFSNRLYVQTLNINPGDVIFVSYTKGLNPIKNINGQEMPDLPPTTVINTL
jgi:hypothetical protein